MTIVIYYGISSGSSKVLFATLNLSGIMKNLIWTLLKPMIFLFRIVSIFWNIVRLPWTTLKSLVIKILDLLPDRDHSLQFQIPPTTVECEMYHGTTLENAMKIKSSGFKPSTWGMLGPGVYMSRDINKVR